MIILCFFFRIGHDDYLFGFQDCLDSHGDCHPRDKLESVEPICSVISSHSVEENEPGSGFLRTSGFVEGNVASSANSQQLEIDTSAFLYFLLEFKALRFHFLFLAVSSWNVDVLSLNIDVLEQLLLHVLVITVRRCLFHGEILVQIKGNTILKGYFSLPMPIDQDLVNKLRGRPCCKSKNAILPKTLFLFDNWNHLVSHVVWSQLACCEYLGVYLFRGTQIVCIHELLIY